MTPIERARATPPFGWDALAEEIKPDLFEVSRALQDAAVEQARLAAYMNARALTLDHAHAVWESSRAACAVAKAMGFTYPKLHELSY